MQKIILYSLAMFLFTVIAKAEITISISDTTTKTSHISIPINGTTTNFFGKKVEYTFDLHWVHHELLGIITKNNYALNPNANFSYSFDFESRILTVSSENFRSNFTGTLFEISILLLPRMDFFRPWERVFTITPKNVKVIDGNDTATTVFTNPPARIFIDTVASNQTFREAVSLNYPNPFNYETVIFFSIYEPTPVKMELYAFDGSILQRMPEDIDGALHFSFYDSSNNLIEMENNHTFPQGIYKLVLRINRVQLSSGQYRLSFITNKNRNLLNISFAN